MSILGVDLSLWALRAGNGHSGVDLSLWACIRGAGNEHSGG